MPVDTAVPRVLPGSPPPPPARDFDRVRVRSCPPGRAVLGAEDDGIRRPLLLIWMRGGGVLRQLGRTVQADPGAFCFLPNDAPVWLHDVGPDGAVAVELPLEVEARARECVAGAIGGAITAEEGAAAFLRSFLDTLERQAPTYHPDQAGWVQSCLCDITERVLAECVGPGPTSAERAVLAAKDFATAHLTDLDLTPNRVAREAAVSLRTLNRLFAAEGDSIGAWIRRRRLEHCREDLLDPSKAGRSIGQIGALWGFLDAAHFSRSFKDAYGRSPRAFRAAAGPERHGTADAHRVA